MSHQLPHAERLAQWLHEAYVALAPKHGHEMRDGMARAWSELPASDRDLTINVMQQFIDVYGPTLATARAVWDAACYIWSDWSIGKIDPIRMENLRRALIAYGQQTGDAMPVDPVMRPYEEAANLVTEAVRDGKVDDSLAERILALGRHRSEDQRAGHCTR